MRKKLNPIAKKKKKVLAGAPRVRVSSQVPTRSPQVLVKKNKDGSLAVLNLNDSRKFYKLDGIAAEIWNLINGKLSVQRIKDQMIKKYDPPRKQFDDDVATLFKALQKQRLVERL